MKKTLTMALLLALGVPLTAAGADGVGMYGGTPSRNMVSDETGLPDSWDLETGRNVKWVQPLGSQSYGGPVLAKNSESEPPSRL